MKRNKFWAKSNNSGVVQFDLVAAVVVAAAVV